MDHMQTGLGFLPAGFRSGLDNSTLLKIIVSDVLLQHHSIGDAIWSWRQRQAGAAKDSDADNGHGKMGAQMGCQDAGEPGMNSY